MKVTVTQLKAPWPEGTVVGSIVEIDGDAVPEWALNKCAPYTGPALSMQEQTDAAVLAATEPLQAKIAEQTATIEKLRALAPAGSGELVVNPAAGGDAPTGDAVATPARKTSARAQAAG